MILHISIPALNPLKVANVLAELCQGTVEPFKPLKNAYMVYANDDYGSGFEVYPADIEFQPGLTEDEASRFVQLQQPKKYSATHCAFTTLLSKEAIEAIAARENWRCFYTRRQDLFNLYEFWLENHFLLELILIDDLPEARKSLTRFNELSIK